MEPKVILRAETEERKSIYGTRDELLDEKEKRSLADLVENEINLFATQFIKTLVKNGYIIKMFKREHDLFEHCWEMDFLPFKNMNFLCVDGNRIRLWYSHRSDSYCDEWHDSFNLSARGILSIECDKELPPRMLEGVDPKLLTYFD